MNKFKIIGVIALLIAAAILFVFKLENDSLDFLAGILTALGIGLTLGLLPKKEK
ncbi:hypothetical protein [Polaribacter sp. BM10]|uniref:hypothetical protein n=1 Tax=Polaribacter sp. BM10 TaxID=1529069 RepID=UPI00165692EF|nr:hypothetical protein [Polaribacter sp. BM10]